MAAPDRAGAVIVQPAVPEDVPWPAHTVWWERFTAEERLSWNLLAGVAVNELEVVGEMGIIRHGMRGAMLSTAASRDPALRTALRRLHADEQRHARWFMAWNRRACPWLHRPGRPLALLAAPAPLRAAGRLLASLPGAWIGGLWLALALEEWSCAFADRLVSAPVGSLGPRDPTYLGLHLAHRREELAHVAFDEDLLAAARRDVLPGLRRVMPVAVRGVLEQAMRPRRAVPAATAAFAARHPRWAGTAAAIAADCRQVADSAAYWSSPGVRTSHERLELALHRWSHG